MPDREYEPRPAFYAMKFLRAIVESGVIAEVGQEAFALLAVVATKEDETGYKRPVAFFNDHLASLIGVGRPKNMFRARDAAVHAGWLQYLPGAKGRPARYWITIPDEEGPEGDPKSVSDSVPKKGQNLGIDPTFCTKKGTENGTPSSLSPSLRNTPLPPGGGRCEVLGALDSTTAELVAALARCTGTSPDANRRALLRTAKRLLAEDPPITPEEVADFGRRYPRLCPWSARHGRSQPSPREVEKYVVRVRGPADRPRPKPTARAELTEAERSAAAEAWERAKRDRPDLFARVPA